MFIILQNSHNLWDLQRFKSHKLWEMVSRKSHKLWDLGEKSHKLWETFSEKSHKLWDFGQKSHNLWDSQIDFCEITLIYIDSKRFINVRKTSVHSKNFHIKRKKIIKFISIFKISEVQNQFFRCYF